MFFFKRYGIGVGSETEKEKCAEVSEQVICNKTEEDPPIVVTIHCRGCQQIQAMLSNPSAKCFYHMETFL